MSLTNLRTPFVAIDRARLLRNIQAMQARANAAGVTLRPHAKTHKSPAIAKLQIDAGAVAAFPGSSSGLPRRHIEDLVRFITALRFERRE